MWSIQNANHGEDLEYNYNILNIVVNTEQTVLLMIILMHYNILNIVVNTELVEALNLSLIDYNILNIVVNTEQYELHL